MPPRFLQRLDRQAKAYKALFGEPKFDPPPYCLPTSAKPLVVESTQQTPPPHYSRISAPPPSICGERMALPEGSLILVTGACGWQGIHVVDQLLQRGYHVRGTVRECDARANRTSRYFSRKYGAGTFTISAVPDMALPGAFDVAVRGCAGVVHCASVTNFSPDPTEVITPSIAGALNLLESAAMELSIKRVVVTSSTMAASAAGANTRAEIASDSWNMSAFSAAWQPPPYDKDPMRPWEVYCSSKLQMEQAAWRWCGDHRPHFVLNTVLPGVLWGQVLEPHYQNYPTSAGGLKAVWDGGTFPALPQHFCDVQDSALLHVAALLLPDVENQRIFAAAAPFNMTSIVSLLRGLHPERQFAQPVENGVDMTVFSEAGRAEVLLARMGKKGFTDIETSVERCCEAFIKGEGNGC